MPEDKTYEKFPKDMPLPKKSWRLRLVALVLIVTLLVFGGGMAMYLFKTQPTAERKKPERMQTLVKTMTAARETTHVTIVAQGTVVPATEINLQSRVSGEITYLHPGFTPGGIIKGNEILARIDDTDYRLVLRRRENALAQARADLRIEEGNQQIALQEWDIVREQFADMDTSSKDLVLRAPQLEKARANITAATTDVEAATIDLERTVIRAPFNAIVRKKNIDLGSQSSPQSVIALLAGIDTFWAEVSIPTDKLAWIDLPDERGTGSPVALFANKTTYRGKIAKLMPDIDPDGLMARLRIAVADPMGLASGKPPLLLGGIVRVEITGKSLANVFRVPRSAVVNGEQILIAGPDDTLQIRQITIAWKDAEHVYIDDGLETGERIITSTVPAPIAGMPLDTGEMMNSPGTEKVENGN